MASDDLHHFVAAQDPVIDLVLEELRAGRKSSHWMWFVFPQIAGLGGSAMSSRYAIADLDHAQRYLAHPVLGERLVAWTRLMLASQGHDAEAILGGIDALKFRSCMTLFREAAQEPAQKALFDQALNKFFGGVADEATLNALTV